MSRRWIWLGGGAAALLTVAVGITTNQVLNNRVWSWPWFAAAVAFAAATVMLGRRMAAADQPRATLRPDLVDCKGHPLLVSQVTPRQLGVHRSRFGPQGDSPYVARDVDEGLATALREGDRRLVIVQGPRLAGVTSTLAQAAQTYLASHRILAYVHDPRITVAQMVAQSRRWADTGPGAVLWVDDITPGQLGQLDRALLDGLPAGLWILATVHDKHLRGFRTPEHVRLLLEEAAVVVRLGTISGRERDALRAESTYAALGAVLDSGDELLMGRLMVALDQILEVLIGGSAEESAERVALLRAVTDWYRVDMPLLLTRRVLEDLYTAYRRELAEQNHDRPVSATRFIRALAWANASSSWQRPLLVDLEGSGRNGWYTPHPLLAVVADDTGQPGAWPVADALWGYADRILHGNQRRDIGYAALDRGAFPHARRLLGHDDTQIDPVAMHQVATWLHRTGDVTAARHWYTKVIPTGHADAAPAAMFNLGNLEQEQGDLGQARRWWERAIATGHADAAPVAMINLGVLEQQQGDLGQARRWWERAIATGHADAAPEAMINLGVLEYKQGDLGQARRWWERTIATGHAEHAPRAMFNLGDLEQEQGDLGQARRRYGEAIATGHAGQAPRAMINLGNLEYEQGDLGQARRRYGEAIATGHAEYAPRAMFNLGNLEREQGDLGQARRRYGEAIATGHPGAAPEAMVNLGIVEYEQGDLGQARHWYTKVISTGHAGQAPRAMFNLGILEQQQGDLGQARRRYGEAIATGHAEYAPRAMFNLGNLEREQGDLGQARRWYGEAIATGHPEVSARARRDLRELERREGERRRAEHFGRYGWQAYADPQLMKPGSTGPDSGQPAGDEDEPSPQ